METLIYLIYEISLWGMLVTLACDYVLHDVKYAVATLILLVIHIIARIIRSHIYYDEDEDDE
jgi:hypothetical protein